MVTFGPLTTESVSGVWGTPANFNGFRVLASLLQWHRSTEVNHTLHDVWPSPGLIHYVYIFGCPWRNFSRCIIQFASKSILAALLHGTWAVGVSQNLRRATRNGITELSQRAPPIFGWSAIMLGIGPHSSYNQTNYKCMIYTLQTQVKSHCTSAYLECWNIEPFKIAVLNVSCWYLIMVNVSGKARNMLVHTTNKNVVCDVSRVLTLRVERESIAIYLPAVCYCCVDVVQRRCNG